MSERDPVAGTAHQRPRALPAPVFANATSSGTCVVAIGASAGGLHACKRFLAAIPANSGMAFILVQHLDPTHASMLVELLGETSLIPVLQAAEGMPLQPDHLYVIPPGVYLAVRAGALHLSKPREPHGARLAFDFLLRSLAADAASRAICVILSGSGADGTTGIVAIKQAGGLVIVQMPEEAGYDGMPRSAIATGLVDFVLPVDDIAEALVKYQKTLEAPLRSAELTKIIALLRDKTPHDFTAYKTGTLERRIARRIGLAGIAPGDADAYLRILQQDPAERDRLASDLLINVTSFFRDPKIFSIFQGFIPDLITACAGRPIRIWVAGCSTGEETYSLAILFQEQILAAGTRTALQIFASDVDAAAVATARDGFYPSSIEAEVTPARLARFFTKEEHGYRITPELRGNIVFAVQDVLADPPFSKLDVISCRNLMIYLRPPAQANLISIFNFALRHNGMLLLGSAETIGNADAMFTTLSKPARLYRKISSANASSFTAPTGRSEPLRALGRTGAELAASRGRDLAEICRRLVLDAYAPAAILVNPRLESLYSFGPTERYLRVAPGYPTHDVTAMIRPAYRTRFKAAVAEAVKTNLRVSLAGGRALRDGLSIPFNIEVTPVLHDGTKFLLICFIDQPKPDRRLSGKPAADSTALRALEEELGAARRDLQAALQSVEASAQEQNAIREEALSINEEYQSTNEELLTSKEELQSLNEELTALNSQLQETLERSRMTANDLQNVLFSTDVATLFLDADLNIRFFTPATKSLFTLIPGDLGRPLADLHPLATDDALQADANLVLKNATPIAREVQTQNGDWYNRRILPYRTHDNHVAGVVITFTDITERKAIAANLLAAQLNAEQANITKSRFLAAASHDLRQPMQTLTLLNGLLEKVVEGKQATALLKKLGETTDAMTGILNTLLDINQIDAGIIKAEIVSYQLDELLPRLGREFSDLAQARGLTFKLVTSALHIRTDPRILEQMLRNLLSNAVKYTSHGRVLMGCRRHGKMLAIEIWDTGLGIPETELKAIFEEYHQVDNTARERSRGLGLGLSIVRRLGALLDHRVAVRSIPEKGSVFTIEVAIAQPPFEPLSAPSVPREKPASRPATTGTILVIEDDPDIRQLLEIFLTEEGHHVAVARDGEAAFALIRAGTIRPDLILADYNLPNGVDGLQVVTTLRTMLLKPVSVIIVTGDISTDTMRRIAATDCRQVNKPMKLVELNDVIQQALRNAALAQNPSQPASFASGDIIYVVDDDEAILDSMRMVFEAEQHPVEVFADGETFLKTAPFHNGGCVLLDAKLPGISGFEVLAQLQTLHPHLPAIMMTGQGDVKTAVLAMKIGAVDFVEKPVRNADLIACVDRIFEQSKNRSAHSTYQDKAAAQIASLTARQRQVMELVLSGQASKNIAADLGISQRTVENHRASIMEKTGTRSIPELVRLAIAAAETSPDTKVELKPDTKAEPKPEIG
jgi:two-component system CheB/CheR fusion protein